MALSNRYPSLKGKGVFISGGASGIGSALVEAFCRQQARVLFVDILDEEAGELCARLAASPDCTAPVYRHCDLHDIAALKLIIENAEASIGATLSVVINNAASDLRHDFRTVTEQSWNDRINVNLRHAFFAIQAAFPQMQQSGGGSIINFGSMSWHENQSGMTCYTTAKAGIEGMTRGLARDLGEHGIRINTLVPGWVMTARQLRDWVNEDTEKHIRNSQCLKDRLLPDDIAAMALFLAADDSRMCSAQNFIVDGGWI